MCTSHFVLQYEDAYIPRNLQNWSLPRVTKEYPTAREGYTQFIANDRGHLLPSVPRSKDSPWGTYLGTWDMPLKIPPAKVNLTSRSVAAAAHITEWIKKSTALNTACNGLTTEVTGAPSDPKEAPPKRTHPTTKGSQHPASAAKMPAQEEIHHQGAAMPKGPLSRQPGSIDIRMKEGASPEVQAPQPLDAKELNSRCASETPLSRQPGSMDVRLKDAATPKLPALSRPCSREPAPRRTISAETPPVEPPEVPGTQNQRGQHPGAVGLPPPGIDGSQSEESPFPGGPGVRPPRDEGQPGLGGSEDPGRDGCGPE
ncbi:hypothetical protein lerEdw1_003009 [Lerista edwardsae]|nr:hypothetical protein lerEdw1_003009 [Lerista edwardsae]